MKDKFSFENIFLFRYTKTREVTFTEKRLELMFFRKIKIIFNWGW